ncbi:MAG: hypothetical protein A2751_03870 [Candidatus Doudnabacteria bacterium RIFCSPHIGHO2_01_FULL_46_14]|uniref:Uncharacterized protein n=1 Tax=Candidatus Doudnabacteria bacterium RIFCSPHIGHO2_01_FULL_46_14 TaxID=1817824 RepID=A0A1F5NL73_9BACT|nr:MAG: hypothetical protein A2751_03870 [Candidatus Doudnabacteria bacterium RIFCSPHIGHO2_01_FULL_46_14]
MLEDMLANMDDGFLIRQSTAIGSDSIGYIDEARSFLTVRARPVFIFLTFINSVLNEAGVMGCLVMVTMLRRQQQSTTDSNWLEDILPRLDHDTCIRYAGEIGQDLKMFSESVRQLIDNRAGAFKAVLSCMTQVFGDEFLVGALVMLEMIRRAEAMKVNT